MICVVLNIVARMGRADSEVRGEASRSMLGVRYCFCLEALRWRLAKDPQIRGVYLKKRVEDAVETASLVSNEQKRDRKLLS